MLTRTAPIDQEGPFHRFREILVKDGETVEPGAVLGSIVEGGKGSGKSDAKPAPKSAEPAETKTQSREEKGESKPAKAK